MICSIGEMGLLRYSDLEIFCVALRTMVPRANTLSRYIEDRVNLCEENKGISQE